MLTLNDNSVIIGGTKKDLTPEQVKAIEEIINKEEEWPKIGQTYWYLASDGISPARWDDDEAYFNEEDLARKKRGLIFRTKAEAELADQKRIAINTIWKYWRKNCKWEEDWKDEDQVKYIICHNTIDNKLYAYTCYFFNLCPLLPVYQSVDNAEQAVKDLEKEYKIIFDVE